ncbi:hypothetical protein BV25DRAFT_1916953 [Artomyces pyxidatus]|uniref:Uncharacterized protein n=1 Tax=Artomyces pyxidatus TaxID=48021 RepID=A0ACB8SZI2_9AGAM|nr:hypothetical protein BV25DRAFT_1916953 [Artomyces pyxidatus]
MSNYEITAIAIPVLHPNAPAGIVAPPVQAMRINDVRKFQRRGHGVCEGCYKHIRSSHDDGSSCDGCMTADVVELRKCARCKTIFYCSKACQKIDWKKHRQYCSQSAIDNEKMRQEQLLDARCESLEDFCKKKEVFRQLAPLLANIADAATAGIQSSERHALLVYAEWNSSNTDEKATLSPRTPQHFIRKAGLVPISRIEQILDKMCAAESAKGLPVAYIGWHRKTVKELTPRPGGWIPLLVLDETLSYPANHMSMHVRYRTGPRLFRPGSTLWNIQKLVNAGEPDDLWRDCKVDQDTIQRGRPDQVVNLNVR